MNLAASGMIGFEPFVRVLSMSEGSPVPILRESWLISFIPRQFHSRTSRSLPVVCSDVDLVSRAAPQIFQSVLLSGRTHLCSFPVAEFRFVVNRVSMDRSVVSRVRSKLHRQRVGGGSSEGDLR